MLLPHRPLGAVPGPADWARHKETIARLYLVENKTLKEVDEIMRTEHNFRATVKMYKSRFKQWDFRKKLTTDEGIKFEAQMVAGKRPSLPSVRGRQLGSQRLKARIAELKASPTGTRATGAHGSTTLPRMIDLPDQLKIDDLALRTIATYSESCLGIWGPKHFLGGDNRTRVWTSKMDLAVVRIQTNNDLTSSFQFFSKSCDGLRSVLKIQEPELLWGALQIIIRLRKHDFRLALSFTNLIAGLCSIDLGPSHPLTIFLTCMLRTEMSLASIGRLVVPVLDLQIDLLRKHGPSGNWLVPMLMSIVARFLNQHEMITIEDAEKRLELSIRLTEECAMSDSRISATEAKNRIFRIYVLRVCTYAEAGNIKKGSEVLGRAEEWLENNPGVGPKSWVNLTELKGHFSNMAGDYTAAEEYFKRSVIIARDELKEDPPIRLGYSFAELRDFYIAQGNIEAAERVRVDYENHLKLLAGEVDQA